MLRLGLSPQMARGELLIKTKTEFIVTCSLTEWRHIFKQRTSAAAHPQMVELMRPQLEEFKRKIPVLFDDITY
jgi:thymidylate synthase (FAD)